MRLSKQGKMKKRPGPLAPPGKIRPRRRITARSYSRTIYSTSRLARKLQVGFGHLHVAYLDGDQKAEWQGEQKDDVREHDEQETAAAEPVLHIIEGVILNCQKTSKVSKHQTGGPQNGDPTFF